ncbi:hypothetical protein M2418_002542 [Rhizobium sp. BIGb0125]|nr:hypothetical protein [Rhizobium sp. BIGb0125]
MSSQIEFSRYSRHDNLSPYPTKATRLVIKRRKRERAQLIAAPRNNVFGEGMRGSRTPYSAAPSTMSRAPPARAQFDRDDTRIGCPDTRQRNSAPHHHLGQAPATYPRALRTTQLKKPQKKAAHMRESHLLRSQISDNYCCQIKQKPCDHTISWKNRTPFKRSFPSCRGSSGSSRH